MSATHRVQEWKSWCKARIVGWKNEWKERWGLPVACVSVCIAVVFFVYKITPWLSDTTLFWLKLVSFIITAILGAVGVVTDFRDVNKNLTRPGKLNLAGLGLAAVIGIMAQKAEYENTSKSSAEAKKKDDLLLERVGSLLEGNKRILGAADKSLRGIKRSLEKLDDRITVRYAAHIPLEGFLYRGAGDNLLKRIQELAPSGQYADEHTYIIQRRAKSGHIVFVANFDSKSELMPQNQFLSLELSHVAFEVEFYKTEPKFLRDCFKQPTPDARYVWYELPTASVSPTFHVGETHLESPTLGYFTDANYILQSSLFGAEFRLDFNSGRILSVLDFSRTYLRVAPPIGSNIKFEQFTVEIGHRRPFSVPIKQFVKDRCGGFTYRLPEFDDE
jgi:hypothetical protein